MKKHSSSMLRQGDLLFIQRSSLPDEKTLMGGSPIVLAEGETTGHAHRISLQSLGRAWTTPAADIWLEVSGNGAQVTHEEHGPLSLEPAIYEVRRQREYDAVFGRPVYVPD